MKKTLSLLVAALMLFSSLSALAADKEARQPDVYVNNALIEFADQNAYITDEGRTLVPARGVFEALDCEVGWDADNYVVTVTKESQKKEIVLKIDDAEMKIVTDGKEEVKTLEVPAQLMNNRTMIPLRAVSEALGCAIIWNEAEYTISISEMRQISNEEFNEKLQMIFNASQNKEKEEEVDHQNEPPALVESDCVIKLVVPEPVAKVGDVIKVELNIENNPGIAAMLLEIDYDKEVFEPVNATNGEVFPELIENIKDGKLFWVNANNVVDSGTLVTLEFAVMEESVNGEYEIGLKYDPYEDVIDEAMRSVGIKVETCKISVSKQ